MKNKKLLNSGKFTRRGNGGSDKTRKGEMSRVDYNGVQEKTDISTDVIGDYGNRILVHLVPWEPVSNHVFLYFIAQFSLSSFWLFYQSVH